MARRLSLYSATGTCCIAEARSGSVASLAPKQMVTAETGEGMLVTARAATRAAQRVLYPLYPRSSTSAERE